MLETVKPKVSIAIPCLNESEHVEATIRGLLGDCYPNIVQVLVADGGSTDGTQDIVRKVIQCDPRVRLVHNHRRLQSYGLNMMLDVAFGDIFLRADAHCEYSPDYVSKCVEELLRTNAANVGGAQRIVAKTAFQLGLSLAARSILGNGGAKFRDWKYEGSADTVFLGCFWTGHLRAVGGYSSDVLVNEDAELNLRLRRCVLRPHFKKVMHVGTQGWGQIDRRNVVFVSARIGVYYFPRKTARALFLQYLKYGRGRFLTVAKHRLRVPGRVLMIPIGITLILLAFVLLMVKKGPELALSLLIVLSAIPLVESLRLLAVYRDQLMSVMWRGDESEVPSRLETVCYSSVALVIMPIAYSCGFAYQAIRRLVFGKPAW